MSDAPLRTDQQREAVRDPARDVFLRAGAGTGKTTVLVDRFCTAALDPEVGVERILAFTFTERAADQLRRRVRAELARMASEASEPELLERLREAEQKTERAWISTIHGFCRRVLASHPAAAGIDPRFRVLDEAEADRLAERAFDGALDERVAGGDPEALELAASNWRRTLIGMTRTAYDELRSQGSVKPALPDPPSVDPAERISELIAAAERAAEACEEASTAKALVNLERIGRAATLDPAADLSMELMEELASLKLEGGGQLFKGDEAVAYKRALERARAAIAGVVMADAYEQLRELVAAFGTHYERLKAARSALDFEDLQLQAVALLTGNERLRERYREQFRHLLVDEFQDTNALQLSLVGALRGPDTRLFCVGDEFQSIYGFRHADVEVYRREHARFAEGAEPNGVALPLTGNFRSAPEIVAATNAIGVNLLKGFEPLSAGVAEPPPGEGDPIVELALVKDDKKGWDDATVELHRPPDDPSPAPKFAEARVLASRLRELADAGEDPAEMVVLLRAFTHVSAYERVLSEAGLDPYVVGGRGFWSQQQVEDMRALLAVIANPLDDEALFGALASPAGGAVLPDTLWLLRAAASSPPREEGERERTNHIWPLLRDLHAEGAPSPENGFADRAARIPDDELARLNAFTATVIDLRRRGAEGGLETLVESAASAFGYDLATLMRDHGRERWANVRKLMRLAREFESHEGPDLVAFIDYLGSRAASRDREAEAATRAEGHAGVRLMTVHAAKGLEFEVVAVPDLGRNLNLGWVPLRVEAGAESPDEGEEARVGVQLGRLGRPSERLHDYEELTERAADRGAEEEARLAYVAATRAKRRLLLSGTFSDNGVKKKEDLGRRPIAVQLIRTLLDRDPASRVIEIAPAADGAPSGRIAVRLFEPEPGMGAALTPAPPAVAAAIPVEPGSPPLGRPDPPPALAGGLSYSALSGFERCGFRFYAERVLGISGSERPVAQPDPEAGEEKADAPVDARHRFGPGVAVHALLEWSARHGWQQPGAEQAEAAMREQGLEPAESEELAARALELVGAWLSSPLRAELEGAKVSAEVPFVLSVSDTLIRGSIDLLAELPDGRVVVVDYKTDRLHGEGPAEAASRYEVQRDIYALAAGSRAGSVETVYVFLEEPGAPARTQFEAAELESARGRIEALLAELARGDFPVTDRPHRRLCHDCPARERLCSHTIDSQMRDDPDPPIEPPTGRAEAPTPASQPAAPEGGAEESADEGDQMSLL